MSNEHDNDRTRPGVPVPGNAEATLANLSAEYNTTASHLSATARLLAAVGGPERVVALRKLAAEAGELGDIAHDVRRLLWSMSEEEE